MWWQGDTFNVVQQVKDKKTWGTLCGWTLVWRCIAITLKIALRGFERYGLIVTVDAANPNFLTNEAIL